MTTYDPGIPPRADVVVTQSPALSEAVLRARAAGVPPADGTPLRRRQAQADPRFLIRKALVESMSSDPNGYERVIGASDLLSVNFLERGRRAATAVCRIKVPAEGAAWYGTGFMVGPRLLLTNHHVLGNRDEAAQAEAQFGYEHDLDGVLAAPVGFNLTPHEIFFTDAVLDFTLVSVAPLSEEAVPIGRYNRLPLLPVSGKAVNGEWVSIIQHPGGEAKQIAIQSSQILALDPQAAKDVDLESFIHYSTDTEPGSSGSPVLNDQWQVLALHHKAVPAPPNPLNPNAPLEFVANEGVRVSAIFRHLEQQRFRDPAAGLALDRLEMSLGLSPMGRAVPAAGDSLLESDRAALPLDHWKDVAGYDAAFLTLPLSLPAIYSTPLAQGRVAPLLAGTGHELAYRHFSAVIDKARKFPLLTAVNIDGARLVRPGERKNTWRRDARIADEYQPAGNFYEKGKGDDPVQFSRGHQVRFVDPCWGSQAESEQAAVDTFHYTNAAPQVQTYNDIDWGDLEDYLLDKAQASEKRLTVFTGPIFRDEDPFYGRSRKGGPWRVPLSFWKVAVLQKTAAEVAAAAFIVGQTQYVQALYEAKVFSGLKPYTADELRSRRIQTTVAAVEQETGLDFGVLKRFDAQAGLESTRRTRWVRGLDDVII